MKKNILNPEKKSYMLFVSFILATFLFLICFKKSSVFEGTFLKMSGNMIDFMFPVFSYGDENGLPGQILECAFPILGCSNEINENKGKDYLDNFNNSNTRNQNRKYDKTATITDADEICDDEKFEMTEGDSEETDMLPAVSHGDNPVTYNGITYDMNKLRDYDFMINNVFAIDKSAKILEEEIDAEALLEKDMKIDLSGDDYKILIYHTHGSENFADSREGVIEDSIIGIGDELTRILEEQYGIKVYHDRTIYDMVNGKLDRSYAYKLSSDGLDKILKENPSIEVVIDLHRDGVPDNMHLLTEVDGRPTAKIMFLNGVSRSKANGDIKHLYNPNKIDNLSFSLQLFLEGRKINADYVRKIYIKSYRFNLEKKPRSTLIEAGAQTNTIEEEKNAMIPLAYILFSVLSGEN